MALQNGFSINSTPLDESGETTPLLKKQVVDVDDSVPPQCCSARYNLAIMMFFGFSVVYGLRVNLSVAMVAMVNGTNSQTTLNSSVGHECPVSSHGNNNGSQTPDQPDGIPQYSWDSPTQGLLLGAFFFGYLVTQIPGGYLAGHFGGSIFLGGGVLGTAALTLLTPLAAQLGPYWLFGLRALEGFGEGVTFPAMMAMWARWAPPLERSRLISLSGSGANFGAFVALPLTGFICHSLGWPAVFYMCGGAGCIWAVFWFILVSDQPGTHPRISTREKHYIINSIGKDGGAHGWSVPLLPMVLSVPLWAIIVSQMCANWGYYTLLTSLPTYMDTVLHFDLRQDTFSTRCHRKAKKIIKDNNHPSHCLFTPLSSRRRECLSLSSALSGWLGLLSDIRCSSRQPPGEGAVECNSCPQDLHYHRSAAACSVPGCCGLLRLQWGVGCDLPHPLYHCWGHQCSRGLHQPDRHCSTVCGGAFRNHQHFRDYPRCCRAHHHRLSHQRSLLGGMEECVLSISRDQRRRSACLHLVWQREGPEMGPGRGGAGRNRERWVNPYMTDRQTDMT
ncbi:sialin-like isoform X1 [Oncorhynchus nerka]|uniref:sialin-like isoform X1 n=1 Tax=Oncorhynchus nerka TaxID=8023 RepID=UPI0031B82E01